MSLWEKKISIWRNYLKRAFLKYFLEEKMIYMKFTSISLIFQDGETKNEDEFRIGKVRWRGNVSGRVSIASLLQGTTLQPLGPPPPPSPSIWPLPRFLRERLGSRVASWCLVLTFHLPSGLFYRYTLCTPFPHVH